MVDVRCSVDGQSDRLVDKIETKRNKEKTIVEKWNGRKKIQFVAAFIDISLSRQKETRCR